MIETDKQIQTKTEQIIEDDENANTQNNNQHNNTTLLTPTSSETKSGYASSEGEAARTYRTEFSSVAGGYSTSTYIKSKTFAYVYTFLISVTHVTNTARLRVYLN